MGRTVRKGPRLVRDGEREDVREQCEEVSPWACLTPQRLAA
jgi:hypothetical protein